MKDIILKTGVILVLIFMVQPSYAQDSLDVKNRKYQIAIEQKEIFEDFETDTISIFINSPNVELKGFALKIATQTQFFTIEDVIPGDFYNDCGWKFYNSKELISDFSAINFVQVWQAIGLAEIFADSISPSCFSAKRKESLARVIISRNSYTQITDTIIPLFFLWEDCSDNTIAGMSGNELYVSGQVFQYFDNQPIFEKNQFPTTQGVPATCIKPSAINAPMRNIEFLHGGIIIKERKIVDSLILDK